jgi:hypothetical protein
MGAFGLIHYAKDFAAAARSVPALEGFRPARYFLICHSIELGLKAFLALQGRPVVELMDAYGHRLLQALDDAIAQGLLNLAPLTEAQQAEIRGASDAYNGKVFEYPALAVAMEGFRDRPDIEVLMGAADVLIDGLYVICRDR